MRLLEAVPNVSEGRDEALVGAIGTAFASHARLLDVHRDPDHNRAVFTLAGTDDELVASLVAGVARSVELVDLRMHKGVHPRIGVVDVVPVVPLHPGDMQRAVAASARVADRIGAELGLPVFLYAESKEGLRPAHYRRGGPAELQRRMDAGELVPDVGPSGLDAAVGAVLVGARKPLVAFNLELASDDLEAARSIAASVRESSGGLPGVQALGLRLARAGRAQVSLNVIDLERVRLDEVVAAVRREAAARGIEIAKGELVGLLPESCVTDPHALALDALPDELVLERRIAMSDP